MKRARLFVAVGLPLLVGVWSGGCSALIDVEATFDDSGPGGASPGEDVAGAAGNGGGSGMGASSGNPGDAGAGAQPGDSEPPECVFGELRCDGLTPETCTESGQWAPTRGPCAIACLEGECAECAEDEVRCRDRAAQACMGGKWLTQEVCEKECEAGDCVGACSAEGRLQCNGSTLQVCDGESYVDDEKCPFLCQDDQNGTARCDGECSPDSRRCTAAGQAESCSASGEWDSSTATACEQRGTFCVNGDCKPCQPGFKRCSQAIPQECSQDGEWVNQGACTDAAPVCFDGACVLCEPNDTRCNENNLEQCESDGASWELFESSGARSEAATRRPPGACGRDRSGGARRQFSITRSYGASRTYDTCGLSPQRSCSCQ